MGLTNNSTGIKAVDNGLIIKKRDESDRVIALAGNPNVGKSTVFNQLTGLNQHTGNWSGKTVSNAQGYCNYGGKNYVMVDIPGTYSLMSHSTEEQVARDFICFGKPDVVIVVCDATCLERNLNLVLQTLEITSNVIVCVNLMDEAQRKSIYVDIELLSSQLGVPVVATRARNGKGLEELMQAVEDMLDKRLVIRPVKPRYISSIEFAVKIIENTLKEAVGDKINHRWLALKLLENDDSLIDSLKEYLGEDISENDEVKQSIIYAKENLQLDNITSFEITDKIVSCLVLTCEGICLDVVSFGRADYNNFDRKIDRILTSKVTGFPIMLLMLGMIFWITITFANYPSQMLSSIFLGLEQPLYNALLYIRIPNIVCQMLVFGMYRVLTWVVAVMLPPMAIFFPLFTLLEDLGYLPRVAFNLDKYFKKCDACGKQSLTMAMGFGCNAAGIVGCRIIDSPRERLIAIITNNFVPCNGRFPTLIAIITMFFVSHSGGLFTSIISSILLTSIILFGILMTFAVSKILSSTILKGIPSSFTLELPPYRRPQIGRVIVTSIFDRTLFVLGRAIAVAAPAGIVIWLLANIYISNENLLYYCSSFLDPLGRSLGMDGVILMAFILGFPANEIVMPIVIMSYMSTGSLVDMGNLNELKSLLVQNGWTYVTAISTMLFSLMHWPCSTACLTIKKETQSLKWTVVSFLVPTIMGSIVCFLFAQLARLLY